jgi:hypothetical protein
MSCIEPDYDKMRSTISYDLVYKSHDWQLDDSQSFGAESVMSKLHCARCNATIILIMTPFDQDSEKYKLGQSARSESGADRIS